MMKSNVRQLPSLYQPIISSRISSFDDYKQRERQIKQAYRAELTQEIDELSQRERKDRTAKTKDRAQMIHLVEGDRRRAEEGKYAKIKTEQIYMADNKQMMKETVWSPPKLGDQSTYYREHPFSKLADQQDNRKKQTKLNFIYQNQLNDIQTEMKKQQNSRRRIFESQQRKAYVNQVEQQYSIRIKERQAFERKYLKLDKFSNEDCKKEHLKYLKEQAKANRIERKKMVSEYSQVSSASPGFIGMLPCNFDRQLQLETIERSLKLIRQQKSTRVKSSFETGMSEQLKSVRDVSKTINYEKVINETPIATLEPTISNISAKQSATIKPLRAETNTQLSQSSHKTPVRRQFKYTDIITGSARMLQI